MKFRHFGESLQVFVKILSVYFLFRLNAEPFWQNCDIAGQIFSVPDDTILKNNLTTWSHWLASNTIQSMLKYTGFKRQVDGIRYK